MNYGWRFVTLYRRQGAKPSPSCEMKRSQKQRRKVKIYPFEFRVLKNSKEK